MVVDLCLNVFDDLETSNLILEVTEVTDFVTVVLDLEIIVAVLAF